MSAILILWGVGPSTVFLHDGERGKIKGEIGCCWLSLSGQRESFINLGIFSHDRSDNLGFGLSNSSSIFVCNAQEDLLYCPGSCDSLG